MNEHVKRRHFRVKTRFFRKSEVLAQKWSSTALLQKGFQAPILVIGAPPRYEKASARLLKSQKSVLKSI